MGRSCSASNCCAKTSSSLFGTFVVWRVLVTRKYFRNRNITYLLLFVPKTIIALIVCGENRGTSQLPTNTGIADTLRSLSTMHVVRWLRLSGKKLGSVIKRCVFSKDSSLTVTRVTHRGPDRQVLALTCLAAKHRCCLVQFFSICCKDRIRLRPKSNKSKGVGARQARWKAVNQVRAGPVERCSLAPGQFWFLHGFFPPQHGWCSLVNHTACVPYDLCLSFLQTCKLMAVIEVATVIEQPVL